MMRASMILAAAAAVLLTAGVAVARPASPPLASGLALEMTPIAPPSVSTAATTGAEVLMSMPAQPQKSCGFDSDCSHGKCQGGKCGGCGFDSECKGWGKCSGGQCGACGFDSECKDFGGCSSGKCKESPYKD